jgi:hypothetical protein
LLIALDFSTIRFDCNPILQLGTEIVGNHGLEVVVELCPYYNFCHSTKSATLDPAQCRHRDNATKREVDHIRGSSAPQKNKQSIFVKNRAGAIDHPIVGAHPPLQPRCCSIYFLLWWVLLEHFSLPFVLQIALCAASVDAHNTTINIITSGNRAIRALTTMFTVEDSSDNDFGDKHNGWKNNKQ